MRLSEMCKRTLQGLDILFNFLIFLKESNNFNNKLTSFYFKVISHLEGSNAYHEQCVRESVWHSTQHAGEDERWAESKKRPDTYGY